MHFVKRLILIVFAASLSAALSYGPAKPATPDYIMHETPTADSALTTESPMPDVFNDEKREARLLTRLRDKLKVMSPFWADTALNLRLRTYYFDRDTENYPGSRAWALGGWLSYKSGWAADRVQLGGTLYTSQPLDAPNDKDGSLLLAPGQEAITVLGQAYLKFKLIDKTELTLFRQELDLPFINRQDNRMAPNTYEGYTLLSTTWDSCKFIVSHITKIKKRDANSFVSMSEAAGIKNSNEGVSLAGVLFQPMDYFNLGFIDQYSWDHMNTFYSEANFAWLPDQETGLKLSGQFARQNSVGDKLGGDFSTHFWGVQANASYKGAVLTLAYTAVDDGAAILFPYGGYPGYSSLIVKKFNRAAEQCWVAGLSYDFGRIGLKGVSGFVNYGRGYTPDQGQNAAPDQDELDLTLDYRPKDGAMQGFWLRLRAAFVDQGGAKAADVTEYQFICNYDFNLL
ncbi:OprD family porin [Patescibacteria group bacterium]|nr:OprD family porin [Patescibacteria group bacterium]MBU1449034.1 OprD family porin [Patescibacteria group bacterium]